MSSSHIQERLRFVICISQLPVSSIHLLWKKGVGVLGCDLSPRERKKWTKLPNIVIRLLTFCTLNTTLLRESYPHLHPLPQALLAPTPSFLLLSWTLIAIDTLQHPSTSTLPLINTKHGLLPHLPSSPTCRLRSSFSPRGREDTIHWRSIHRLTRHWNVLWHPRCVVL